LNDALEIDGRFVAAPFELFEITRVFAGAQLVDETRGAL
jgi:hypothetical protein